MFLQFKCRCLPVRTWVCMRPDTTPPLDRCDAVTTVGSVQTQSQQLLDTCSEPCSLRRSNYEKVYKKVKDEQKKNQEQKRESVQLPLYFSLAISLPFNPFLPFPVFLSLDWGRGVFEMRDQRLVAHPPPLINTAQKERFCDCSSHCPTGPAAVPCIDQI